MEKNTIKKYAVWARQEMIDRVRQKAAQYGITDAEIIPADAISIDGNLLSPVVMEQRKALIQQINAKGYQEVMEEVAYTWFNRFIALRFMEVNGYLPSRVRVFTDAENAFHPQILAEAIDLELDGLDMEKVYALKSANEEETLYKYLLITQCNALNPILPGMFQKIADYTELLLPDNLLREGSVIQRMIEWIPEKDWQDQVQIIGWLYQYYNSEKKDDVFAALKKNVKITKENIPAATQLFTPDWIVRYMVENSLGRLWIERNAGTAVNEYDERPGDWNEHLLHNWKYYVFDAQQDPEVIENMRVHQKELASLTPEQLKCIDPCCGSGHILAYLFDVLIQIYENHGYTTRDAVENIILENVYGLDIDERAAQLSYFAVMMKAQQYDRRFLYRKNEIGVPCVPQPNVFAIEESNGIRRNSLKYFGWSMSDTERNMALTQVIDLLDTMLDAKEYGSILAVKDYDWELLYRFVATVDYSGQLDFDAGNLEKTKEKLQKLVEIAVILAQKYDVVVTNPPYMGISNASTKVQEYVKKEYPDSKSDMFAVFMERCGQMTKENGYQAMITQHTWMFIASYEKIREKLLGKTLINMLHLGARAFDEIAGEVVQTAAFVFSNMSFRNYRGKYYRLLRGSSEKEKEELFFARQDVYITCQIVFCVIPRIEYIYWISPSLLNAFATYKQVRDFYTVRNGLTTGDNNTFLRLWHEVSEKTINRKWFPCSKGGPFRRWYGNRDYLINWENDGYALKHFTDEKSGKLRSTLRNIEYNFLPAIIVGHVVSGDLPYRYVDAGFISESAVNSIFPTSKEVRIFFLLAALNSKPCNCISAMLSPTLGVSPEDILNIPIPEMNPEQVDELARSNVAISRDDWDSFETSWDFLRHPLLTVIPQNRLLFDAPDNIDLSECFACWQTECTNRFTQLKSNEEELNRIFIDIYGLQDELTPEVEDKDVTVRKADLTCDVKSLISYAVGCMFGRYSLNRQGLVYAGGKWEDTYRRNAIGDGQGSGITIGGIRIAADKDYQINVDDHWQDCTYSPDVDNIIPICDDEYFEDDIVGRFVKFIETVYGKNSLEANLKFIADALGDKGQPRDVIRNYFLNDFFNDHCKIYQKRPIYWQFDSGKKNGFKALIYMHRYQPDLIARIRTDYVHEQQSRYRTAIAGLEQRIAGASTAERVKLTKQLKKLQDQAEELHGYEEKIHHLADQMIAIDLDDGVKVNYAKFQDVLAKIK